MQITRYKPDHYDAAIAFLKKSWAPRHAIYNRELFDWQYRVGAGPESVVILDQGQVRGFLGAIPGTYRVNDEDVPGAALAMWCVAEELRNSGLGILLLKEVEKRHRVLVCLGVNPAVLPMYQRLGYQHQARLHRYVLGLDATAYAKLLARPAEREAVPLSRGGGDCFAMASATAHDLAEAFQRSTPPAFSLVRDEAFFAWRYARSPGFAYRLLKCDAGAAVVRVESAIAPERPDIDGLAVLRIIELLPYELSAARGLVNSVLGWARAQACVAADYQCSSPFLDRALEACGFVDQAKDDSAAASFSQLFQPYRPAAAPINFIWKVLDRDRRPVCIAPAQAYFVKADGDMDRPNIWPLPAGPAERIAC